MSRAMPRNLCSASLRPLPVNGKGGITGRGVPAQQGQLPRELIKTRPQVVGELADQQRDLVGDDIQLKASDVHSLFYLIMFRDSYCLMTKKPLNSFLQSLEVYFRPQGFYAGCELVQQRPCSIVARPCVKAIITLVSKGQGKFNFSMRLPPPLRSRLGGQAKRGNGEMKVQVPRCASL